MTDLPSGQSMLSEGALSEIAAAIAEYPFPRGAAIDALKIVQRHHRWISDELLRETAARLGMSVDELDGVATFYNQLFRRPVGRHLVQSCTGVMCWMLGETAIVTQLQELGLTLGSSGTDGRFTWLPVPCLGACHRAPAMMVDGTLYESLTPEGVSEILARYL